MKKIKNYSDLIAERKRLEQNLIHQKVALKHGFSELKSSLKPMSVLKDLLGIEKGVVGSFTGAGINAGHRYGGEAQYTCKGWVFSTYTGSLCFKNNSQRFYPQ
jgi:hypothetical protein